MQEQKLLVSIANGLVHTRCELSLNQLRLVRHLIAKIRNKVRGLEKDERELEEIDSRKVYGISAEEFSMFWGLGRRKGYEVLQEAAETIAYNPVEFRGETKGIIIPWFSSIGWDNETKTIYIKWNPDIIPYISQLSKNFTTYKLLHIVEARSVYTIKLYELLVAVQNLRKKTLIYDLETLKYYLGVGDKDISYHRYDNFKRRILQPGVEYINKETDLHVIMKEKKIGKKVEAIEFNILVESKYDKS